MSTSETYRAVVRPMVKGWDEKPRSLFFEVIPSIEVANPLGVGDVISNNLYDAPGLVRMTPIIGISDERSTKGMIVRGYRPGVGDVGFFGETERDVENASVKSAIKQLVGNADCTVEFIDIPVKV